MKSRIENFEREIFELNVKNDELQKDLISQKTTVNKAEDGLILKNQELMSMVQKLTNDINKKNAQIAEEGKTMYIREKELQKDRALFVQREKQMMDKINQLQEKIENADKREKEVVLKFEEEKKELTERHNRKINQLAERSQKVD